MSKKAKENTIIHKTVRAATAIIIICFIISSFSIIMLSHLYSIGKYDKKFEMFGVYEKFEKELALNKTSNIISFIESEQELDRNFFNTDERDHLLDVRVIANKIKFLNILSLSLILVSLISLAYVDKNNFFANTSKTLLYSGLAIILILVLALMVYLTIGFDIFFERFHQLLFVDNYAFDPRVSNMKALFPDSFFLYTLKRIYLEVFIIGLLAAAAGTFVRIKIKKRK